jgi:(p)ppGpp synthase/HD superfamily hydrolase
VRPAPPGFPPPAFIEGLPLTLEAYRYAHELHAGQRRGSDEAPFILHPLEVAVLLRNRGFDDEVVAAGLLHDAIEDSDVTRAAIEERLGAPVADLVGALTDDPEIEDWVARKAALREQVAAAGPSVQAIYAADKVAKARELRAEITRDPAHAHDPKIERRLAHYERSLEMLERTAPDLALVRQLRFELWALRNLPPGGTG